MILGVKFAERLLIGMQRPVTTIAVVDLTVLHTLRGEWKDCGNSLEQSECAIPVQREPNLHVDNSDMSQT